MPGKLNSRIPQPTNMRSMNNSIFLDSSILIEHYKGAQTDLLEALVSEAEEPLSIYIGTPVDMTKETTEELVDESIEFRLYICQTVVSEYLFQCLITDSGGKPSPLTLKRNGKIPELIKNDDHADFLSQFHSLPDNSAVFRLAPLLMEQYNLLPNDAIILALCKFHGIKAIASFDQTDFKDFCRDEGIILISSLAQFEAYSASLP